MQFVLNTPSSFAPGVIHHYQTIKSPILFDYCDPLQQQRLKECEKPKILQVSSKTEVQSSRNATNKNSTLKKNKKKIVMKPLSDEQKKLLHKTLDLYNSPKKDDKYINYTSFGFAANQKSLKKEEIDLYLRTSLDYIQQFILFRMQSQWEKTTIGRHRIFVTSMPIQVWDAFYDHCNAQFPVAKRYTSYKIRDHGNYLKYKVESFGYYDVFHIPRLANKDFWHFKRYEAENYGGTFRCMLTRLVFFYCHFTQKLSIEMAYSCSTLQSDLDGTGYYWDTSC